MFFSKKARPLQGSALAVPVVPAFVTAFTGSDNTLCDHGVYDFLEACDVRASYIVAVHSVFIGSFYDCFDDALHDSLKFLIDFFRAPA